MPPRTFAPDEVDWIGSGWGYRVANQDALMYAMSRIGTQDRTKRYVWRGVANGRWRVSSALFRHTAAALGRRPKEADVRAAESQILQAAKDWGLGLENGPLVTDLQLLAALQHEGVPTRLLDVTTNPMTALWFACAEDQGREGAVFAFEVSTVNSYRSNIGLTGQFGGESQGLETALQRSLHGGGPFIVDPSHRNGRMAAQEGLFLSGSTRANDDIDGVDGLPLGRQLTAPGTETLADQFAIRQRGGGRPLSLPFCAVLIPPRVKRMMLDHLAGTYNRRRSSLFPDVGGFRRAFDLGEVDLAVPNRASSGD